MVVVVNICDPWSMAERYLLYYYVVCNFIVVVVVVAGCWQQSMGAERCAEAEESRGAVVLSRSEGAAR